MVDNYNLKSFVITFRKSLFAGVCISFGACIYLSVGGFLGSFLFSFGLLSVVHYELPLYTGKSGFLRTKEDLFKLPLILIGNIIGTFIFSLIIKCVKHEIINKASSIITTRLNNSLIQTFLLAMLCGIIMTIVVKFARNKKYIPLLLGIPLFILCGFIHSIADSFYYFTSSLELTTNNLCKCFVLYFSSVVGNFIGCVIPNIFVYGSIYCEK